MSPERMALIETFKKQSEGLQDRYEARSYKGGAAMPHAFTKLGSVKFSTPCMLLVRIVSEYWAVAEAASSSTAATSIAVPRGEARLNSSGALQYNTSSSK
jgi:hypothetical protein